MFDDFDRNRTLLLVEDEAIIAMEEKASLEELGYTVVIAADAAAAVEAVNRHQISLILMDVDLGTDGPDGIETARKILEKKNIPLIFLSSHIEPDYVESAGSVDAYGYLGKGTSMVLIDNAVRTALKLNESAAADCCSEIDRENQRMESELEITRMMLNDVLNTIPVRVFWKDLSSVYLGCNRLFAEDSGLKEPEDIVGLTDFDIRRPGIAELNRQDDRRVIDSGRAYMNYEEPFPTEGTGSTWIVTSKIPLRNRDGKMYGILGMYEDISERKQIENELVLQKNRLSNILYGSNVGTWEWNIQTGENIVNEHWAEIIGYTLDELPRKNGDLWQEYLHPDDLPPVRKLLERHFAGETEYFESEFRMRHKDGGWVWILSRGKISSKSEDGRPLIMSGTHLDIQQRKLAQEEILQQLSEKELILKEVHHRIKNNFSSISSLLMLQADTVSSPEAVDAIRDAVGRVRSMEILYERLLTAEDYRNASAGVFLDDLVEDIVTIFPDRRQIRLEKNFCDCRLKPKQLFSLGIIVNELITNVMKYAFAGRDSGLISISLEKNGEWVTLVIQDDGIGLPKGFHLENSEGFGLMLINILSRQLDGSFRIEDCGGTKSTLKFRDPISR